jgi:hypothetical protein
MGAGPEGTRVGADVGRRRLHGEAVFGELVRDAKLERERVARRRVEDVPEDHPVRLVLPRLPGCPADEAVDRVPVLGLAQRQPK